jgi:hypothetical protein
LAGTEIWYAKYEITVAEPKVALLPTATVAAAAEAVVFDTIKPVILCTVLAGGLRPGSDVVPSNVQLVVTPVVDGTTYAVCPLIVVSAAMFGFGIIKILK